MSIHNFPREMQEARFPNVSTTPVKIIVLEDGNALWAYGDTLPAEGTSGYAPSCLFLDTNAGADATLTSNEGTGDSSHFLAHATD